MKMISGSSARREGGRDQSPITKFHKKFSFLFSFAYVQVITIYRSNT